MSKIKISVRKDTGYFMSYSGANLHVTMTDGQLNTTTGFLTDVRVLMQRKSFFNKNCNCEGLDLHKNQKVLVR